MDASKKEKNKYMKNIWRNMDIWFEKKFWIKQTAEIFISLKIHYVIGFKLQIELIKNAKIANESFDSNQHTLINNGAIPTLILEKRTPNIISVSFLST